MDQERPDKSKIVVDFHRFPEFPELGLSFVLFEVIEGAFDGSFAKKVAAQSFANRTALLLRYLSGREKLFVPKELSLTEVRLKAFVTDERRIFVVDSNTSCS